MAASDPRYSLRRSLSWTVPLGVLGTVAAATVLPLHAAGGAHPSLPSRSAARLLADVQTSTVRALSGTVVETARVGLPQLPGAGRTATFGWQSLLAGSHTARVWVDGRQRQRVALLGQLSESDVVHSGRHLWTYRSDTQQVTHTVLPPQGHRAASELRDRLAMTPQAAASRVLALVGTTTVVRVDATARVAHRPAYTLTLRPRDHRSTVRQVAVAVDSLTGVPLRVQVFGAAVQPTFETAFTDVSFARPAAEIFRFVPPAGATVRQQPLPSEPRPGTAEHARSSGDMADKAFRTHGSGWTTVVEARSAALPDGPAGDLLHRLTTVLPDGDQLVRTPLLNALLTHDGGAFVGAVTPALLQEVAAGNVR